MKLIGLGVLVMIAFAANSVLGRAALDLTETGPAAYSALRLGSGAALLSLVVLIQGHPGALAPQNAPWRSVIALGIYMIGFALAYITLDAGAGALILFGGVQITMFIGAALSREPLPALRIIGATIAFGGLVWLMVPGTAQPDPIGAAFMVVSAIGWGLFSLQGARSDAPLRTMAASFLWCTPAALVAWAVMQDGIDQNGVILGLISGAITSGMGYALWYYILPMMAASRAAVAQLTVPILAALGGAAFLAEPLTWRFVLASALVLGGVAVSLRAK